MGRWGPSSQVRGGHILDTATLLPRGRGGWTRPQLHLHQSCVQEAPYQYHVTRGDVHVGRHRLLTPGGRAAAGGRTRRWAVAELRGDAVKPGVAQGLWTLHSLRCPDRHPLATQLLHRWEQMVVRNKGRRWWSHVDLQHLTGTLTSGNSAVIREFKNTPTCWAPNWSRVSQTGAPFMYR